MKVRVSLCTAQAGSFVPLALLGTILYHKLAVQYTDVLIGITVNEVVSIIQDALNWQLENPSNTAEGSLDLSSRPLTRDTAAVWSWIVDRKDVSVGKDRELNEVPLDDLFDGRIEARRVSKEETLSGDGSTSSSPEQPVKVSVFEETVWELLSGHGVDHKRIPHLEWVLMRAIAKTKDNGILQGDLGRLVGQDKRSVPKRTDVLVAKGYIVKRTTLLRGTKTSKLWLKFFAPPALKDEEDTTVPQAEMILTQQLLLDDLNTVPWHVRWTGDVIDSTALLTTIMALCKAWGVIRLSDLKAKLGILTLKWQMKIVAKICRFLNARGPIEYVAAKLNDKVYKDCMRYKRDLTARDWSIFLATGKRMTRWAREGGQEAQDNDRELDAEPNTICSVTVIGTAPPWKLDFSLPALVTTCLRTFTDSGLTNPEVCCLTIGSSFSRYISSFTSSISTPNVQPPHLEYLQVRSEHFRSGKVSAYRYSLYGCKNGVEELEEPGNSTASSILDSYGFFEDIGTPRDPLSLPELCGIGTPLRRKRGRPKKLLNSRLDPQDNVQGAQAGMQSAGRESTTRQTKSPTMLRTRSGFQSDAEGQPAKRGRSDAAGNQDTTFSALEELSSSKIDGSVSETVLASIQTDGSELYTTPAAGSARRGGRGRPRGRPNKTDGSSAASVTKHSQNTPWKCDKCGGTWRNDIGLKYHLEKSRTSCNPAFDAEDSAISRKWTSRVSRRGGTDVATQRLAEDGEDAIGVSSKSRVQHRPVTLSDQMSSKISTLRDSSPLESFETREFQPTGAGNKVFQQPIGNTSLIDEESLQRQISIKDIRPQKFNSPATHGRVVGIKQESGQSVITLSDTVNGGSPLENTHQSPASKAVRTKDSDSFRVSNDLLDNVIRSLLQQHDGALAGEASLYQAVRSRWSQLGTDEPCPSRKEVNRLLKAMLRRKLIIEHWHGFRNSNGSFARCQVISWPSVDPFAEEVMNVVEEVKRAFPEPLYLDDNDEADEMKNPSHYHRRVLAADIAVLSAPVYAEQAARHKTNDSKLVQSTRAKKQRLPQNMLKSIDFGDRPPARARRARALWGLQETAAGVDLFIPEASLSNTAVALQIPVENADGMSIHGLAESIETVRHVQKLSARPDAYFLEDFAAILPSRGWALETKCFLSTSQSSDQRDSVYPDNTDAKAWFETKIKDCMRLEMRHATNFIDAEHHPQANDAIFISFCGGASDSTPIRESVDWRSLDQNLEKVVDDESTSSEDEVDEAEEDLDIQFIDPSLNAEPQDAILEQRRTILTTRALSKPYAKSNLPEAEQFIDPHEAAWPFDKSEMLAAFVAVRTLLGGTEKLVDWGLLAHLYPEVSVGKLRRFWSKVRAEQMVYLSRYTSAFQERLITASSFGELPLPNYDDILDYDWQSLIRWTMEIPLQEKFSLPASKTKLSLNYDFQECENPMEDWRERYYQVQSSVLSRYELAAAESGAVIIDAGLVTLGATTELSIAKSWVRSLCSANDEKYTPTEVKERLNALGHGDAQKTSLLLKQAVEELTREKVICRVKTAPSHGRPYRLNDSYSTALTKLAHKEKYKDAAQFKIQLDAEFQLHGSMKIPYNLNDGAVMALTNLIAAGRISLSKLDVPNVPFGFEPGNYESRKYSKSFYHFELVAEPSETYLQNEEVEVLRALAGNELPATGPNCELPQWIDIFGEADYARWFEVFGAFCFTIAVRGSMTIAGICSALNPVLQPYEAELIMRWGNARGVLKTEDDFACSVGEWWWLAVSFFM